ncbi:acyltransferase [Mesorhizobium sp. DCY119]|uniref:acyltransferase family protein n=1 Tax=Mesorhizobium sp. DCY119 TaxID=2108445 RepID=UPI000E6C0B10|nr:acyltransferase [Mesorhizobium sp. DCY119]RJG46399.1 acyltransferase [Mesorhizobium sp. DCY119]
MKKLYGIQYLRAFAALAVVVFHAAERTGGHFAIGAAGVDVFFVVSGFIMWTLAQSRPVTPLQFLRERLERIAPVYWIATAVMVAGAFAGLFPNMKLTLGHVLGSLFFIPHISPSNGEIWPVLVQGWTLNYEMFFYVVFACTLLLPTARRLPALAGLFILLTVIGLSLDSDNPLFRTYTNPAILEFLLGALIGTFWLEGKIPSPASGLALILLAVFGFVFVGVTYVGFHPFVFGPLAVALVTGVLSLERAGMISDFRPLTWIGDASYSIYLWHTLAVSVVAKFAPALSLPAPLALVIAVIAGTGIGLVAYELLEKPIAAAFKTLRRRGAIRTSAMTPPERGIEAVTKT